MAAVTEKFIVTVTIDLDEEEIAEFGFDRDEFHEECGDALIEALDGFSDINEAMSMFTTFSVGTAVNEESK